MFKSFLPYVEAFSHFRSSFLQLHESSVTIPLLNEASIPAEAEPGAFTASIVTFCVPTGNVNFNTCPAFDIVTGSVGFKFIIPLPLRVMLAVMPLLSFP
jgi:hypothetical protein